MKPIMIPEDYNYIAVFLTLACNLKCSYCINHFGGENKPTKHLTGEEWVVVLNRIESCSDLPITLQGGEPSLHKDFIYIINNIKPSLNIDILTNLQFDVDEFIAKVNPNRLKRNSPYASIRVSYHPETMEFFPLLVKVTKLQNAGFSVGIWAILHPKYKQKVEFAKELCMDNRVNIDFRYKEFLGKYEGKMYGVYKYPEACDKKVHKEVLCKTSELIVGPNGHIYKCHADLYEGRLGINDITRENVGLFTNAWYPCNNFGYCNPCDIKIKTNRFQQAGHTSVEIKESNL